MIPNFCLGSHPSRIPLILHGLYFCFQLIKAPYIVFHIFSFFSLTFSTPFFIFFSFLPLLFLFFFFFFLQIWNKRGFSCFILLLCLSAATFLGILGTTGFKMSWALKHTWSLWVALRRPTFSGLWNGGIS